MAINQNHLFEELNGVKCAIVEKNVSPQRVEFLRALLECNKFTVMVVPSPPPKAAPVAPAAPAAPKPAAAEPSAEGSAPSAPVADTPAPAASVPDTPVLPAAPAPPPPPETFTVGVTDVMFNPVNAIFGRLLKTPDGHIVTLAYWQQKEQVADDEKPYFEK